MIGLIEEMTTIYLRLHDNVGITYEQLNRLIALKGANSKFECIKNIELTLSTNNTDKLGWLSYTVYKSISEEEKEFIKDYIRKALEPNEVIIEINDYKLDSQLFNDLTNIRRVVQ